jgi:hypothetical protein
MSWLQVDNVRLITSFRHQILLTINTQKGSLKIRLHELPTTSFTMFKCDGGTSRK